MNTKFTNYLLHWLENNPRELVWKQDTDAYSTWLSEIIMQQTRVAYGTNYYLKFKELFPTVYDLANAPQEQVMKAWEGLGYYSRARNLHHTAKTVVNDYQGTFPTSSKELEKLKGIGPYTAAAIASFVYNEPVAAIDGNAYRVLSRYFGISTPIDSTQGKKEFQQLGNQVIDRKRPGEFNQAIMNFGALICTPKQPYCIDCGLNNSCKAFLQKEVLQYPKKEKKTKMKKRYFTFFIIHDGEFTYIEERTKKDIWQNLWQFPLIETKTEKVNPALELFQEKYPTLTFQIKQIHAPIRQQLSHQTIIANFIEISIAANQTISQFKKIKWNDIQKFPFAKISNDFLKNL